MRNLTRALLALALLLGCARFAHAQQVQILCETTPSNVACNPSTGPSNTGNGYPAWKWAGYENQMWGQWYALTGIVVAQGTSTAPRIATYTDIAALFTGCSGSNVLPDLLTGACVAGGGGGGGGSPGGSTNSVQYNNGAGAFGGFSIPDGELLQANASTGALQGAPTVNSGSFALIDDSTTCGSGSSACTFANLPSCSSGTPAGTRYLQTDAAWNPTSGTAASGGGSSTWPVECVSDGGTYQWTYVGGASSGSSGGNLQVFTGTGANTWMKPSSGNWVRVILIGGGGGGGSGGSIASGTASTGGGGGGGAYYADETFPFSLFTGNVTCTVATGGTGGAAATGANGNAGGQGGTTTFGSYLSGFGGGGGGAGGTAASEGAGGGGSTQSGGSTYPGVIGGGTAASGAGGGAASGDGGSGGGGDAVGAAGSGGGYAAKGGTGGGAGGGLTAAPAATNGAGGTGNLGTPSGVAGGSGTGSAGTSNAGFTAGTGGAGGASNASSTGFSGGAGAVGGGGGGGGASISTHASGAGGNGGNGECVVITY